MHGPSIDFLRHRGLTEGVTADRYLPASLVSRGQVASFAIRALDLVVTRPSWERAVELIHACQVDGAFQAHDLSASLDL